MIICKSLFEIFCLKWGNTTQDFEMPRGLCQFLHWTLNNYLCAWAQIFYSVRQNGEKGQLVAGWTIGTSLLAFKILQVRLVRWWYWITKWNVFQTQTCFTKRSHNSRWAFCMLQYWMCVLPSGGSRRTLRMGGTPSKWDALVRRLIRPTRGLWKVKHFATIDPCTLFA